MKNYPVRIALMAAITWVALGAGCNVVDTTSENLHRSEVVLHEKFCVRFDENRTTGQFESEVVSDQFATMITQWLADNGVGAGDVKKIFMSGGRIKLAGEFSGHAWDITSSVRIHRTDIADGPQKFLKSQTVTIPDDVDGKGYKPRFDSRGVKLVNRALEDLVDGGAPVLVVTMTSTDVDPEPSVDDPLVFSWDACVDIMAIVKKGGGHHGDDDDDDDDDNGDGHDDGDDDDHGDHDDDD